MARQVMVVDDTASHTESPTNPVAEIQAKLAETLADDGSATKAINSDRPLLKSGPLAALKRGPLRTSPLETIAKTAESVERVKKLEQQLSAGQSVVELNPEDIDASFVPDRMAPSEDDHRKLVEAIRSEGQLVPILVRPHPEKLGRSNCLRTPPSSCYHGTWHHGPCRRAGAHGRTASCRARPGK